MVGRYAIIENGRVANIAVAEPDYAAARGWLELPHGVGPGWLYDGQTFSSPPEPTVPVPASITPRQCRLILSAQGLLSDVEAMIAQQDEATRITWEYALEFRRDDPLLVQLAANLVPPLTDEQIDQFFIAAAQL